MGFTSTEAQVQAIRQTAAYSTSVSPRDISYAIALAAPIKKTGVVGSLCDSLVSVQELCPGFGASHCPDKSVYWRNLLDSATHRVNLFLDAYYPRRHTKFHEVQTAYCFSLWFFAYLRGTLFLWTILIRSTRSIRVLLPEFPFGPLDCYLQL